MEEKMQRAIDRQAALGTNLAQTQVANAIGEATLALLASGETLTLDSLAKALAQQVAHLPENALLRQRNEAAQTALRDALARAGR